MIYADLFWGFLKVGIFSFGGAYGAIPLIRDVVLSYGWMDDEMVTYMIAVSESTPGPIMVNLATYVGSSQAGLTGALAATLAVILPSFVIIVLVMEILKNMFRNQFVQAFLRGVEPCVTGIILGVGCYMILNNCVAFDSGMVPDRRALLLTAVLGTVYFGAKKGKRKRISPFALIFLAACAGAVVYAV